MESTWTYRTHIFTNFPVNFLDRKQKTASRYVRVRTKSIVECFSPSPNIFVQVTFKHNPSWHKHMAPFSTSATKKLEFISRARNYLPLPNQMTLNQEYFSHLRGIIKLIGDSLSKGKYSKYIISMVCSFPEWPNFRIICQLFSLSSKSLYSCINRLKLSPGHHDQAFCSRCVARKQKYSWSKEGK